MPKSSKQRQQYSAKDFLPLFTEEEGQKNIYHARFEINRIKFQLPLAKRIDLAWDIYTRGANDPEISDAQRGIAQKFLIYALNIRPDPKISINQQMIDLMMDRKKHKNQNPEYIPGKAATRLPFDPSTVVLQNSYSRQEIVQQAVNLGELLDVNDDSKRLDQYRDTIYLHSKERALHRVVIANGEFKKNGKTFSTSKMISHKKPGFAAYTLNCNGELSVFNHRQMVDKVAHSTMNAGAPVIAAGEIQIENGRLKAITTHSGHYQPSLFNVYRMLEHLDRQGIDISEAKVITLDKNPSTILVGYKNI